MDISTVALGGPMIVAIIWALVSFAKRAVPRMSPDWYWVLACGIGSVFSVLSAVASGPTSRASVESSLITGISLGLLAVGAHESGKRVPAVISDAYDYLNFVRYGTHASAQDTADSAPPDPLPVAPDPLPVAPVPLPVTS